MKLREYQQRTIDELYQWFSNGNIGNPCLVLPTGSGKSHIIAALCKDAIQTWPETRILMLTHVKELISQNHEKMLQHWQDAPIGIYSAGIGIKQLGEPITFAGIQSIRNKSSEIGHVDLIIIDECHLVSHKDEGGYRSLINELTEINPSLRVVGLTATPYRLGHGLITDKPAIFDALIEPVSIEELIYKGYLSTLRSKLTSAHLDVTGVHKRGGEYIESELQAAVNTKSNNASVVDEVIKLAGDRKAWLFFCSGVEHAKAVAIELTEKGIVAECITGETQKSERERLLTLFRSGEIRALTNANVLTTGFDYPDIDLIAMLRPTMSPVLYVQMAGRGMRVKSHTDHCLVLDFAGVVATHGPITNVQPPDKKGEKEGEAPVKVCEQCHELVHISVMTCPTCGYEFPPREKPKLKLHDEDIMGIQGQEMAVTSWAWRRHISRASGNIMLSVTYYGGLSDPPITEYLPVLNGGYAGSKAARMLFFIAEKSKADLTECANFTDTNNELDYAVIKMNQSIHPSLIEYKKDGKFYRVVNRSWENE
jgi:DNA repair protein RadD